MPRSSFFFTTGGLAIDGAASGAVAADNGAGTALGARASGEGELATTLADVTALAGEAVAGAT